MPLIETFGSSSAKGFGLGTSKPSLYEFTSHTFTSAGVTGRTGPNLAQLQSAYSSATWAQNTLNLNMSSQGIQEWRVPATGNYYIDAYGSGSGTDSGGFVGPGARIADTFALTEGEIIKIVCGQKGPTNSSSASGGGGGTYVVKSPYNTNLSILVIAGGGGGPEGSPGQPALTYANTTKNGQNGRNEGSLNGDGGGAGGTDGNGGGTASSSNCGGGGGGFFSNGTFNNPMGAQGGFAFVNGSNGGGTPNASAYGGFGGGGASYGNGGGPAGGGGYSGGGGGDNVGGSSGGGGGSYFDNGLNINRITTQNANTNNGYVVITKVA